jgi:hypothetical protein
LVFRNIFSCCIKQALWTYPLCHPQTIYQFNITCWMSYYITYVTILRR